MLPVLWPLAEEGDSNAGRLDKERGALARCAEDGGDAAVSACYLSVGSSCDAPRAQEIQRGARAPCPCSAVTAANVSLQVVCQGGELLLLLLVKCGTLL